MMGHCRAAMLQTSSRASRDISSPTCSIATDVNCIGRIGRKTANGRVLSDDVEVAEALLEESEIVVVLGTVFGSSLHFRVPIALEVQLSQKAMERPDFSLWQLGSTAVARNLDAKITTLLRECAC